MKKLIALLLALVLCLSLCACGGDSAKAPDATETQNSPAATEEVKESQPVGTEEKTEEQEQEEPVEEGPLTLRFNEVVRGENLEFSVVYAEFLNHNYRDYPHLNTAPLEDDETHVFFRLALVVKNIGKKAYTVPASLFGTLDYNDGYVFESVGKGALSTIWGELLLFPLAEQEPLSSPSVVGALYKVPKEVMDNKNAPISIALKIDDKEYIYHVRPEEDASDIKVEPGSIVEYANKKLDTYAIKNCLRWSFRDEFREDIEATTRMLWSMEGRHNRFADEWIARIESHLSDLDKIDEERFSEIFPEACAELKDIQSDHKKLCELLRQCSETMTAEKLDEITDFSYSFWKRIDEFSYYSDNHIELIEAALIKG